MAGNTTAQKWDFEGHLRASGQVNAQGAWNGNRSTFTYDASGMRLTSATLNAAGVVTDGTSYVWDGDRVAEERDEKGVLQAVYEHGQELGPLRLTRRAGTLAHRSSRSVTSSAMGRTALVNCWMRTGLSKTATSTMPLAWACPMVRARRKTASNTPASSKMRADCIICGRGITTRELVGS